MGVHDAPVTAFPTALGTYIRKSNLISMKQTQTKTERESSQIFICL